jgi:hypothetical protein
VSARPARVGLRTGLRRLASGLIVYGAIGLAIAAVGLIALIWLSGRVGGLAERTGNQVTTIVETLDRTSTALSEASSSATSFAGTLARTGPAVRQVAVAIGDLRGNFRTIEDQLGRVQVLGSQPFGNVAGQFGQMASDLDGLDERLELIADDLERNRAALAVNAESLAEIGTRLDGIATEARDGSIAGGLDDLRTVVTLLALLLVVWVALPAVGALSLGWWLRGALGEGAPTDAGGVKVVRRG